MRPRTIAPQTTLRQTTLPRAALPRTALLATAGRLAGVDGAAVEQLSNRLLDREVAITVASPDRSALNNNGDPLQVCISVAPDRSGVRIIADPATDEADPAARRQRSRSAMERLLIDAALPVAPFRRMLEMVQPDEAADSWDPAVGESWLAAPVAGTGLAVYGNGAWGPPEVVWPRVLRWLRTDLAAGAGAGAGAGVERVERAARAGYVTPAAVGLETDRRGSRRVKVYVRLAARVP
ncbi:MAG: hypothetical protein JWP95_1387, partial [Actinotalea sp.]|nr:hypothetical protein [Actinotalea sp.]